ncbi:GHKL domain-containing protein [uncultured Clostridium sp.]|uniref:sensor histidine kinase n=1 Tax=uncultured Clostridium sp. TaxID=59620 RepID=UPI002628E4E5|nr:GHKL domain-containing protein [uncultured Clostridium sp.]
MVILKPETIFLLNIISTFSLVVIYTFLANFNRKLFYKKRDYIIGFGLYIIITTLFNIIIPTMGIIVSLVGIVVLGNRLYNNEKIYIVYYFIFSVFMLIGQLIFSEGFKVIFSYLNIKNISIEIYLITNGVIIQLANLACCRLFLALFKRNIKKLTIQQYFSFLILPIFSFVYILTLVNFLQGQWMINIKEDIILFIINLVLIVFFNIFITNIFEAISKNNELKGKLELYEKQKIMEYDYYTSLESKYNSSRKVIHDIKNHMQTIDSLYEIGEKKEAKDYLKNMYGLLDSLGQKVYTENKVLNVVINDKVHLAKKSDIDIKVLIGEVDLKLIKEIDITTIISNLLDNAIEGTKETENKEITLKIDKFNNFLIINVANSFKKVKVIDEIFKTTKENHLGLGLENIKRTAEKYSGSINIKTSDNIFKVNIMIPN